MIGRSLHIHGLPCGLLERSLIGIACRAGSWRFRLPPRCYRWVKTRDKDWSTSKRVLQYFRRRFASPFFPNDSTLARMVGKNEKGSSLWAEAASFLIWAQTM